MNYIPLNIKTQYELLSSLIKIDELCLFIKNNNINSIGITDTNMFGTMEFFHTCKLYNIKPIIGIPIKIDTFDMILYALNYDGYINLLNLVSIKNTSDLKINNLKKHKDNIICVTNDINNYLNYKEIYELVYLSYKSSEEKKNALLYTDKIVYMNESFYINNNDEEYLKYLRMIKDGKTIDDINDYKFSNYINKDIEEIDAKTTYEFSNLINIELPKYNIELPEYSNNSIELLNTLTNKGLNKRLNGNVTDKYKERLNKELDVIINMNFADYFLIVYDFILFAKKNDILVGPGRGSAAGSLVSYSLGITEIDPLKFDLSFERFLNKDRVTLPDIDTDIEYLRRDEVIEYVKNKYGKDKVANIITFGTLLPKQIIRDISRVLKISNIKVEKLIKYIKDKDTFNDLKNNQIFMNYINSDIELQKLIRICSKLEGLKRHTSIHAAGVIISKYPLMNKVPLYMSSDQILTGYTMEYLEELGLIKMDFLALKNLTIIDNILKMIKDKDNLFIDTNRIPLNDTKTLNIFYNVDTTGIFQFESEGMKSFLEILKVKTFDDLVLAIAMYRPGSRDNIPELIKVRNGKSKPKYIVPELENILKSTYGIIVYQEQIIEVLKTIGGFSYNKADIIRRAMSKKKESVMLQYKNEFINGACINGYDKDKAETIYNLVLKFANYGFNKSHSVAYSMVAYSLAFLKAHFREYYMITLLNMSSGSVIKTKEYIDESKINGLNIEGVNLNISTNNYELYNNKIYLPFTLIKNIGYDTTISILEERNKGKFTNYIDTVKRLYLNKVNEKTIEYLILSGAFDEFKYNRKTMINNLSNIISYANLCKDLDESLVLKPEIIIEREYNDDIIMKYEFDLFGFYLKNHPVTKYKRNNTCLLKDIKNYFDKNITIICLVENIKETNTKNGEKMAFITISDEYSKETLVVFPKLYKDLNYDINKGDILKVICKVEKRMSNYELIGSSILKL